MDRELLDEATGARQWRRWYRRRVIDLRTSRSDVPLARRARSPGSAQALVSLLVRSVTAIGILLITPPWVLALIGGPLAIGVSVAVMPIHPSPSMQSTFSATWWLRRWSELEFSSLCANLSNGGFSPRTIACGGAARD